MSRFPSFSAATALVEKASVFVAHIRGCLLARHRLCRTRRTAVDGVESPEVRAWGETAQRAQSPCKDRRLWFAPLLIDPPVVPDVQG